jgi:hypothetical protein
MAEELFAALCEANTAFSVEAQQLSVEQIERARKATLAELTPAEREQLVMDIAHSAKMQDLVYSQSELLKQTAVAAGLNLSNFLNGINTGTCATLSWQICLQLRAAGFPAFLLQGNTLQGGQYLTDPGHQQILVLLPQPILLDPTAWANKTLQFDQDRVGAELAAKMEQVSRVESAAAFSIGVEARAAAVREKPLSRSPVTVRDDLTPQPDQALVLRDRELKLPLRLAAALRAADESGVLDDLNQLAHEFKDCLLAFGRGEEGASAELGGQLYGMLVPLLNSERFDPRRRCCLLETSASRPELLEPLFDAALTPGMLQQGESNRFLHVVWQVLQHCRPTEESLPRYLKALHVVTEGVIRGRQSWSPDHSPQGPLLGVLYGEYLEAHRACRPREAPPAALAARDAVILSAQKARAAFKPGDARLVVEVLSRIPDPEHWDIPEATRSFLRELGRAGAASGGLASDLTPAPAMQRSLAETVAATGRSPAQVALLTRSVERCFDIELDLSPCRDELTACIAAGNEVLRQIGIPLPEGENSFSRWCFHGEGRAAGSQEVALVTLACRGGVDLAVLRTRWPAGPDDALAAREFASSLREIRVQEGGDLILQRDSQRSDDPNLARIPAGLPMLAVLAPQAFLGRPEGQEIVYISAKLEELGYFAGNDEYALMRAWSLAHTEEFLTFAEQVAAYTGRGTVESSLMSCLERAASGFSDAAYLYGVASAEGIVNRERGLGGDAAAAGAAYTRACTEIDAALARGDIPAFEARVRDLAADSAHASKLEAGAIGLYYLHDRIQQREARFYSVVSSVSNLYWHACEQRPYFSSGASHPLDQVWQRVLLDMHYFRQCPISDEMVRGELVELFKKLPSGRGQSSSRLIVELDGGRVLTPSWTEEYLGNREYGCGDDLRLVDYKLLARLDKYYVKLFGARPPEQNGVDKVLLLADLDCFITNPLTPHPHIRLATAYAMAALNEGKQVQVLAFFRGAPVWAMAGQQSHTNWGSAKLFAHDLFKSLWISGYDAGCSYAKAWERSYPLTPLFRTIPAPVAADRTNHRSRTLCVFACSPTVIAETLKRHPILRNLRQAHLREFQTVALQDVI